LNFRLSKGQVTEPSSSAKPPEGSLNTGTTKTETRGTNSR